MAPMIALFLAAAGEALVFIPQVPPDLPARSEPAPVRDASSRPVSPQGVVGVRQLADGRIAIPKATIEACRRVQLGEKAPQGIDCLQVMQIVEADTRRSAEGSLLRLLGQRPEVTQGAAARPTVSTDADAVARDISNGVANGNAAVVAAHQRSAPPASPPR